MTQAIGHQPALQVLRLIDGQDLTHVFKVIGDPLPVGSTVALHILNRDKTATYGIWPLMDETAGWTVFIDAADHASIPHGSWFRLAVTYPTQGRHYWIAGNVERNRR
ncbi:LtfC-like domain-containing protein [Mycolicibacterium setense]